MNQHKTAKVKKEKWDWDQTIDKRQSWQHKLEIRVEGKSLVRAIMDNSNHFCDVE